MKTTNLRIVLSLTVAAFAFGLASTAMAGPTIVISPPSVVISPPPPPVVAAPPVVVAPDNYYWDGNEYVGIVGGQYYYLGPGNNWMVMDPARRHRFDTWEHAHPDWHSHAIHNEKYRGHYDHNHAAPTHDSHDSHDSHDDNHDNHHDDHDHNFGPP